MKCLIVAPFIQAALARLDELTREIGLEEGYAQQRHARKLKDGYEYIAMAVGRHNLHRLIGLDPDTRYIIVLECELDYEVVELLKGVKQ